MFIVPAFLLIPGDNADEAISHAADIACKLNKDWLADRGASLRLDEVIDHAELRDSEQAGDRPATILDSFAIENQLRTNLIASSVGTAAVTKALHRLVKAYGTGSFNTTAQRDALQAARLLLAQPGMVQP